MSTAIAANDTLGDLVTADPRRARILEELGLDYCCGGQRTLQQACTAAGADITTVTAALDLADPEPAPQWQSLGLGDLAEHIVATHHAYLWREMQPLADLVNKVHRVHGDRHPELARIAEAYALAVADLGPHMFKEEQILFSRIQASAGSGDRQALQMLRGPITQMLREHDYVGELFAELRELTNGFTAPADGCGSYQQMMVRLAEMEADLHEHIHKENNVLFPRALEPTA